MTKRTLIVTLILAASVITVVYAMQRPADDGAQPAAERVETVVIVGKREHATEQQR